MDRVEVSSARTAAGQSSNATRSGHRGSRGGASSSNAAAGASSSRNAVVRSSDANRDGCRVSSGEASSSNARPRTSSSRDIESSPSRTSVRRNGQKLSMEMEREVIQFLELFSAHYFRFQQQRQISDMTNAYLKFVCTSADKPENVSNRWAPGLFARHPGFEQWWKRPKEADARCAATVQGEKERLGRFLQALNDCIQEKGIPQSNIYLISHTAYALAVERETKLSISHPRKVPRHDTREIASVVSACSRRGKRLSPYIIFKRDAESHDTKNHAESVRISYNSTGHVNDGNMFFDWLRHTFEGETNPERRTGVDAPARLILLDDEKFEVSPRFFVECFSRNIFLFSFPRESRKAFSPLESAVSSFLDAEYSKYMSKKFRQKSKSKAQRFRMENAKFSNFMHDRLTKPELESLTKKAWIESCLVPSNAAGLSDLIRRELSTPAPDAWGSPRVPRSAPRPLQPIQTPGAGHSKLTAESETDEADGTFDTSDLEDWHHEGGPPAPAAQSPEEEEEEEEEEEDEGDEDAGGNAEGNEPSSGPDEDEPVHEWQHPVDSEDFRNFVQSIPDPDDVAAMRRYQDGLMGFFEGYRHFMVQSVNVPPKTPKRPLIPRTPKSSKKRRTR